MKRLKAYEVRNDYEGHCCIEFATSNAAARRTGAGELNIDWEDVEHCRRKPEFDQYAPGPVPMQVLLEHGWWFTCHECDRKVSEDLAQDVEDDGLDPDDFAITIEGEAIYCSIACSNKHWLKKRRRVAAHAAFVEVVEARFPGCSVKHIHIYGDRLEPGFHRNGSYESDAKCIARFAFPGGKYLASWVFGASTASVSQDDLEAFSVLYRRPESPASSEVQS